MTVMRSAALLLLILLPQVARLQEVDWAAEATRLEMNRQHWNTHNVHRYELLVDVRCFCFQRTPVRLIVESGAIVGVEDPQTGEPIRAHPLDGNEGEAPMDPEWYPTVDALFAEVERAIANRDGTTHPGPKARRFSVEYDEQYGYPSTFSVDYSRWLDADGSYSTSTDSTFQYRLSELAVEPLPYRGAWVRTSDAPLSPRTRATIAWAAGEIFVFGGIEHYCPSGAACLPPSTPPFADGAAYDPQTDTWRRIADAPAGIIQAQTVTIGDAVFALALTSFDERRFHLLRYRPEQDRWDEVALPDDMLEPRITAAGADLLYFPYTDASGNVPDWRLDVATGAWTVLPAHPLGPAFSRQYVAAGDDLYLFDHALVPSPGSAAPSLLRAARLRARQWEVLPVANSVGMAPDLVEDGLLIAPALGCADGGGANAWGTCVPFGAMFDTATDTWRELPNAPRRGYKSVQSSGGVSAEGLVLGIPGHPALDATTFEWFTVPAVDADRTVQRNIVAAGPYGFAFGGARPGGVLLNEAWVWRP